MTKQEIMQFLKRCVDLKDEYDYLNAREDGLKNRLKQLEKQPNLAYKKRNESIIPGVIMTSLAMGLVCFPFVAIALALFKFDTSDFLYNIFHWAFFNDHPYWTHWLFSWIVPSICLIPFSKSVQSAQKEANLQEIEKYNNALTQKPMLVQELKSIPQKKQMVNARIQQEMSRGILYKGYFPYANDLWWYMHRGQADTLKEAINLLEREFTDARQLQAQEQFHKTMLDHAQRQGEALASIADDTERAANAAESAELWSAASTLLTASEIKRQREKR